MGLNPSHPLCYWAQQPGGAVGLPIGVTWEKYVEGWGARGVSAPPGPPTILS